jgi:TonB family protein
VRGLGYGLDEKAVEAARQWEFQPANRKDHPLTITISIEVVFRLRTWTIARLEFAADPETVKPEQKSTPLPDPSQCKGGGTLTVAFQIGANRAAQNALVIKSSNQDLNELAMKTVEGWKFTPATRNKTPVDVSAETDLECK